MNKKILLVGGGGHCKSIISSLLLINKFDEISIIDVDKNIGKEILGCKIIGTDDDLEKLFNNGYKFAFISLGSIGNPLPRRKLYKLIQKIGFETPNIIDVTANISNDSKLGTGIFVGKNCIINAGTNIQNLSIINSGAIIEHDSVVESFVHVAPGSVVCGDVFIGENSHIGAGSVIKEQIYIGSNTIIGLGSVVIENISSNKLAFGNPCKVVSNNESKNNR